MYVKEVTCSTNAGPPSERLSNRAQILATKYRQLHSPELTTQQRSVDNFHQPQTTLREELQADVHSVVRRICVKVILLRLSHFLRLMLNTFHPRVGKVAQRGDVGSGGEGEDGERFVVADRPRDRKRKK